jgi:hypothetical protein
MTVLHIMEMECPAKKGENCRALTVSYPAALDEVPTRLEISSTRVLLSRFPVYQKLLANPRK